MTFELEYCAYNKVAIAIIIPRSVHSAEFLYFELLKLALHFPRNVNRVISKAFHVRQLYSPFSLNRSTKFFNMRATSLVVCRYPHSTSPGWNLAIKEIR